MGGRTNILGNRAFILHDTVGRKIRVEKTRGRLTPSTHDMGRFLDRLMPPTHHMWRLLTAVFAQCDGKVACHREIQHTFHAVSCMISWYVGTQEPDTSDRIWNWSVSCITHEISPLARPTLRSKGL